MVPLMVIDDLLDARILSEIATRSSFAGAAGALDVPAATVSRRVARMEREAGLRLFERTSRRVEVTEAGALVIEQARRMIEAATEMDASLEEARGAPRGTVRVTAMHDMATMLLGEVTNRFLGAHPECQLSISLTDRKVDLVAEGVDVAIRANAPGGNDLVVRRLGTIRFRMHARPSLAARIRSVEDFLDADFGVFGLESEHAGPGRIRHQITMHGATGLHFEQIEPRLKVNDLSLLRHAALTGDLVVGMPTSYVREDVEAGRLAPVLPGVCGLDIDIFAVLPSRRHMRPAVRAFLDLAASHIGSTLREDAPGRASAA